MKTSKNKVITKRREVLISVFLFFLFFFFLFSLFAEKSFFPFVKFKMFDSVVKEPVSTVFYISTVDANNNETIIKKKLMNPMSNREVAGLLNLGNDKVKKAVSDLLLKRAKDSFPDINKFRLYEYRCDCLAFYELQESLKYFDFINSKCSKKMLMEKKYE